MATLKEPDKFIREDPIRCSRCGSYADARAIKCPFCSLQFYATEAK